MKKVNATLKRMLAGLVTVAMLVTSIPVSAFAATQETVDDAALLTSQQGDYAVEETSEEAAEDVSVEAATETTEEVTDEATGEESEEAAEEITVEPSAEASLEASEEASQELSTEEAAEASSESSVIESEEQDVLAGDSAGSHVTLFTSLERDKLNIIDSDVEAPGLEQIDAGIFETAGGAITVKFKLKDGVDGALYNVSLPYRLGSEGTEEDSEVTKGADGSYTAVIPKDVVLLAESTGDKIFAFFETEKRSVEITFAADKQGRGDFYEYEPVVVDGDNIYTKGDKVKNAFSENPGEEAVVRTECGKSIYFVYSIDEKYKEYFEMDCVVIDGKKVEPTFDQFFENSDAKDDGWLTDSSLYYAIEDIKAPHKVEPVLKPKAVSSEEQYELDVLNDSGTCKFSIDKKYASVTTDSDGHRTVHILKFVKDVSEFGFSLTCNYDYEPTVCLGEHYKGTFKEMMTLQPSEVKDDGKYKTKTYIYKNLSVLYVNGHQLMITDTKKPDPVVSYRTGDGVDDIEVSCGNKSLYVDDDVFRVSAHKTVTVKVKLNQGYKVVGFYNETDAENIKKISFKGNTATFTVHENMKLFIDTKGVPSVYFSEMIEPIADKQTIHYYWSMGTTYITVLNGGYSGDLLPITSFSAKSGKKKLEGFAVLERGELKLTPESAADGYPNVTLTINGSFGKRTVNVAVEQTVRSLSLKGAKNGKISQTAGTTVAYPVILNTGASFDRCTYKAVSEQGDFKLYEDEKGKLCVDTFKGEKLQTSPITITFFDNDSKEVSKVVINPVTAKKFATPTVKVTAASDNYMDLSIVGAKAMKDLVATYYIVEAKATTKLESTSPMKEEVTQYVPLAKTKDGVTANIRLELSATEGVAQKYNITVIPVQLRDGTRDHEDKFDEGNILVKGTAKALKNQSTKNPYYETKLTLIKKNTSVISGEKGVLLATAKYSAKTSYMMLGDAILKDDHGVEAASVGYGLEISEDGQSVYYEGKSLRPGKYTLEVFPFAPSYTRGSIPTMSVTVKAPVTGINLTVPGSSVYKPAKKAATIKLKASCFSEFDGKNYKPASSKVKWSFEANSSKLQKCIKIKNGVVTIDKNYLVQPYESANMFKVWATACDIKKGTPAKSDVLWFTVVPDSADLTDIFIGEVLGSTLKKPNGRFSSAYNGEDLTGEYLTVFETIAPGYEPDIVERSELTISISPAKGMTYDPNEGKVHVTKPGTYTVKATRKDGSKKSITRRFVVDKADVENRDDPFVVDFYKHESSTSGGGIEFDANNSARLNGSPLINIQARYKTENNNLVGSAPKITVKGGKVYSAFKEYMTDDSNLKSVVVKPTKADVTVTVSGGGKTKTYKLHFDKIQGTIKPASKSIDLYEYNGYKPSLNFNLSGVEIDPEKEYVVALLADEKSFSSESLKYKRDLLAAQIVNNNLVFEKTADNKPKKLTAQYGDHGLDQLPKGKYTYYLGLFEDDGEKMIPVTDMTSVTVNVTATPKSSVELDPKVTIGKAGGSEAVLKFKKKTGFSCYGYSSAVFNDVVNGKCNEFANYFNLVSVKDENGDWIGLKLVRKEEPIPEGVESMTGWISYSFEDLGGDNIKKIDKLTVTLK